MPASDSRNILSPTTALEYAKKLGLAPPEQISAGIRAERLHTSARLTKKVLAGFESLAKHPKRCQLFTWMDLQHNPRGFNRKEIRVLWLSTNREKFSPPDGTVETSGIHWKRTSGIVEQDVICHWKTAPLLAFLREFTKQSEPITGWFARNTRVIASIERDGEQFRRWTSEVVSFGPSGLPCPAALYEKHNGEKRFIVVPVAQHYLSKKEGDWREIFLDQLRKLHRISRDKDADLEVCCPYSPDRPWLSPSND